MTDDGDKLWSWLRLRLCSYLVLSIVSTTSMWGCSWIDSMLLCSHR